MDPAHFLRHEFPTLLNQLQPDTAPRWGVMSAQHMVEHLSEFIGLSTGAFHFPLAVPEEQVPQFRAFLFSDKAFRENTKAPASVLGDDPRPLRFASLTEALADLQATLESYFLYLENHPDETRLHPAFGSLNAGEWLILHYKHTTHHARQFGLLS